MLHRPRHSSHHKETKVKLSPFYKKKNVKDYLDWDMKVEQIFECYQVDQKRRVSQIT